MNFSSRFLRLAGALALFAWTAAPSARAQEERNYIMQTAPYPIFFNPEPAQYNLKWGKLTGRFHASIGTELNDNLNLSQHHGEFDASFAPNVAVGFLWPISQKNNLQFELGVGYRFYVNHPQLDSLIISPNSRLDYRLFLEKIQITLHDNFFVQVDPTDRPDINGKSSTILFRRFNNTAGFIAEWKPRQHLGVYGGYDYSIDRSMADTFASLDHTTHTFSLGANYQLSPSLTAGLNASYALTTYSEPIQNDNESYRVGPYFTLKLSKFLSLDGAVGYSVSHFRHTGSLNDTSDFRGPVFEAGLRHIINSRLSHGLRMSRSHELGFGSNFNDLFSLQYDLQARMSSSIHVNTKVVYENFQTSGLAGEKAQRVLVYLGSGYQLTRRWNFAVAYGFALKDSNLPDNGYLQNRLTLDFSRQF